MNCRPQRRYELHGFVMHHGRRLREGHYTAIGKSTACFQPACSAPCCCTAVKQTNKEGIARFYHFDDDSPPLLIEDMPAYLELKATKTDIYLVLYKQKVALCLWCALS